MDKVFKSNDAVKDGQKMQQIMDRLRREEADGTLSREESEKGDLRTVETA